MTKRLMLSRFFYEMASEYSRSPSDVSSFAAINVLQDAVEIYLLALAEHVNAKIEPRTAFAQYIDKIDEAIAPQRLPFRSRLIQLNKARVASKHDGLRPDVQEIKSFLLVAREFFEEVATAVLDVNFWTISLLDQVDEGEVKDLLRDAQSGFKSGDYKLCLIKCSMASFILFEKDYDVKPFEEDNPFQGLLGHFGNKAPYYAKGKEYIAKNVREPFDYIVLSHDSIDNDLLKNGIDPVTFWNVWRLTPRVYRSADKNWLVRNELEKLDDEGIQERASYVLDSMINMGIQLQNRRRSLRWAARNTDWVVSIKRKGTRLYRKSDRTSEVVGVIPDDLDQVSVEASVPGLKGDGTYWVVAHFFGGQWLQGYVHEDDIVQS